MKIWVDADACPVVIKEILYRAAERTRVQMTLVSQSAIEHAKLGVHKYPAGAARLRRRRR